MSAGTKTNFVIYDEQFYAGQWEAMSQNVNAFNAASDGALVLRPRDHLGDFSSNSNFRDIPGLITRRDTGSVADVADTAMPMDENISVKLNRKAGPIAQTLDSWKKMGQDPRVMSYILGQMMGGAKMKDMLNTILLALVGAISGTGNTHNISAATGDAANATYLALVEALAKMGDQASRIVAWTMHSKPYFNLVGDGIISKVVNVADGFMIYGGVPATLGRPVVVTDSPALLAGGNYSTLGLVAGAATVEESEGQTIMFEPVTGKQNLVYRFQGEYAYNVGCLGFKWRKEAGENPADTALAAAANWTKNVGSDKLTAGTRLVSR